MIDLKVVILGRYIYYGFVCIIYNIYNGSYAIYMIQLNVYLELIMI